MTEEEMQERIKTLEAALEKEQAEKKAALGEKFKATQALEKVSEDKEREAKDVEALEKRLAARYQQQIEEAEAERDNAQKTLRKYRAESAVAKALAENNVDSKHITMLTKATLADLEFGEDGEPTIGGKSVEQWGKSFFAKDGLAYVRAPNNSGGAAQGSDGAKAIRLTKRPSTQAEWDILDSMPNAERNALCDAIGAPDLKV